MAEQDEGVFPWGLGIYDAHCHPTDTMASVPTIPQMKARALTIMATRGEDQELVVNATQKLGAFANSKEVQERGKIVPSFGWHPWFSHQMYDDTRDENNQASPPAPSKADHYGSVLQPTCVDQRFFDSLPDPRPLSTFLSKTEARLTAFPYALIGEVGLDRSFRLPAPWTAEDESKRREGYTPGSREGRGLSPYHVHLSHQKAILKAQLRLAGRLRRPVSVHSVQGHGAVFEVLSDLWAGHEKPVISKRMRKRRGSVPGAHDADAKDGANGIETSQDPSRGKSNQENGLPYPPRICLHSYSGPPDPLSQFLHPSVPATVYFSFSQVINFSSSPAASGTPRSTDKVESVIQAVPDDRILVESDYHTAGEETDRLLEAMVRVVCRIKGWGIREGVEQLGRNWREFVFGADDRSNHPTT